MIEVASTGMCIRNHIASGGRGCIEKKSEGCAGSERGGVGSCNCAVGGIGVTYRGVYDYRGLGEKKTGMRNCPVENDKQKYKKQYPSPPAGILF